MQLRNCWIIEDEPPAMRRLSRLLHQIAPENRITFATDSIAATRKALTVRSHPDVIFSDIHLADGLSFELWESATCNCPIVFTTAYDQYSIRAFRVNGMDYLLKPIAEEELRRSLDKIDRLRHLPDPDWTALMGMLKAQRDNAYRRRFLAQYRNDWVPVETAELRQIYSSDGMTFATGADGKRYLLDETLERIQEELDPKDWFRINRSQIVHVAAVQKVSSYFNHRMVLDLKPAGEGDNIVARTRVKDCRKWLAR
jgi:DNA-binding LytR/AlgR family response regulator